MSLLNTVLKAFVGDKAKKDVKELQPLVVEINKAYEHIKDLDHNALRDKTGEFKSRIADSIKDIQDKIEALQSEVKSSEDIDRNEELYGQIDKLEIEAYKITENTLNELLPEAFAVVKSTAQRFVDNEQIKVKATEFDRLISGSKDL